MPSTIAETQYDGTPAGSQPGQDGTPAYPARPRFLRYLLCIALVTILLYPLPFFLVRLNGFERVAGSGYGPVLEYGFTNAGVNADVVIFGDSSAIHGIDPRQMSSELGLKVVNIPNTITSLSTYNDFPLRRYLRLNKPPRLIIFYLTPWNMDFMSNRPKTYFEGEEMLLRHGNLSEILHYDRNHIVSTIEFPLQVYAAAPHTGGGALLRHEDRVAEARSRGGFMPTQGFRTRLPQGCTIDQIFVQRSGVRSAQKLFHDFRTPGTQTFVFAAPIPDCTNAAAVLAYPYASIPAAPPNVISPNDIIDDSNFIHLAPEVVSQVTQSLANAVRPLLSQQVTTGQNANSDLKPKTAGQAKH